MDHMAIHPNRHSIYPTGRVGVWADLVVHAPAYVAAESDGQIFVGALCGARTVTITRHLDHAPGCLECERLQEGTA